MSSDTKRIAVFSTENGNISAAPLAALINKQTDSDVPMFRYVNSAPPVEPSVLIVCPCGPSPQAVLPLNTAES
jgi:hypothetical protein